MAEFSAQLLIGSDWTTVPVLVRDGVTIAGGRGKDAGATDTLKCNLSLRNRDGALSSKNPRSPYFGRLGRNTQLRATVPDTPHLYIASAASGASTADHSSLDITGDLDVRIDVQPIHWSWPVGLPLTDKYNTTGNNRSWALWVGADGAPVFRWSPDGTFASALTVTATTAAVIPIGGRIAIRATLDVNNGAGGWTVTFYTAATIAGTWTQLGSPVTGVGVTSVFSGNAIVRAGQVGVSIDSYIGRIYALQVRNGINGTVVANPDFTTQTTGATSFVDSVGRTWAPYGTGGEIRDFDVRAHGEVAKWPVRWNVSGQDIWAPLEASGLKRRLDRGTAPLRSPMYREATKDTNRPLLIGYWPAEDGSDAAQIASGIGGPAMKVTGTAPQFASGEQFPGSDNLPVLQSGTALSVNLPASTPTGVIAFRGLFAVPIGGWADPARVAEVGQTGTIRRWVLVYNAGGALRLQGYSVDGNLVVDSGPEAFLVDGRRQMIGWQVTQSGSDIYWQMFTRFINADLSVTQIGIDGTFATQTVGRPTNLLIGPDGALPDGTAGHFMVGNSASLADGLDAAIVGNSGEKAGRRIQRLCLEQGVPFRSMGDLDDTAPAGPQKPGKFLDLLQGCADADGGPLFEARDALTLVYRARTDLYNQAALAALTYGQPGESPHLDPDEPADDVVNDVTVKRTGGSSFQAVDETSPLSVLNYPDGVGRYDVALEFGFATDGQVEPAAWWLLHLGTWDEYQYSSVEINIRRLSDLGKSDLAAAAARMVVADRLVISQPPPWLPAEPIELLTQGWSEEIRPGIRKITFNNTPARPWDVGVAGVDLVDSDGTTLVSSLAAVTPGTSQSVPVDVVGTPWALDSVVPFQMWIRRAERVTVTAISGASSPQTFTMTRGLDGLAIAHPSSSELVLYKPLRWAR